MALFYILPYRPILAHSFRSYLHSIAPGLSINPDDWLEWLQEQTECSSESQKVYLIPREDLPEGQAIAQTLCDGFGAEIGDQIIEMKAGLPLEPFAIASRMIIAEQDRSQVPSLYNSY